jgi:hypothetical protein
VQVGTVCKVVIWLILAECGFCLRDLYSFISP